MEASYTDVRAELIGLIQLAFVGLIPPLRTISVVPCPPKCCIGLAQGCRLIRAITV